MTVSPLRPSPNRSQRVFAGGTQQRAAPTGVPFLAAVPPLRLLGAASERIPALDPAALPADPRLVTRLDPAFCLREGVLPVRQTGGATLVAESRAGALNRNARHLADLLGPILPASLPPDLLEAELARIAGDRLARQAEASVPLRQSSRGWGGPARLPRAALLAALVAVPAVAAPAGFAMAALAWVAVTLIAVTTLRLAALAMLFRPAPVELPPPPLARLPMVSVIVALYREGDIAPRLIQRLGRLEYPRDRLEVLLAVEAGDAPTRDALATATLPDWMRVIVVPDGFPRTKPRALNHALDHCRGTIVGVYDAEDAPEPDQITRIVTRFAARGPQVVCLQGVLDYYNPRTNWLSRCFTIEYAAWFRVILPGIARLGLPVPLGGTTLFFRRDALQQLGGWDAHNVTEDADLGIRLYRHGYRTELIDTVTGEEANCRPVPWIKQRSRWIKGHMMTWFVHMRDPVALWRQMGPAGFAGFQVMFLCALSQSVLAPVMWSFWLLALGLPHPAAPLLPNGVIAPMVSLFLLAETVSIAAGLVGLARTRHGLNPLWVPTLHFYHPLAALAAWKALWEMATRPFWWDKTAHGLFDRAQSVPATVTDTSPTHRPHADQRPGLHVPEQMHLRDPFPEAPEDDGPPLVFHRWRGSPAALSQPVSAGAVAVAAPSL